MRARSSGPRSRLVRVLEPDRAALTAAGSSGGRNFSPELSNTRLPEESKTLTNSSPSTGSPGIVSSATSTWSTSTTSPATISALLSSESFRLEFRLCRSARYSAAQNMARVMASRNTNQRVRRTLIERRSAIFSRVCGPRAGIQRRGPCGSTSDQTLRRSSSASSSHEHRSRL